VNLQEYEQIQPNVMVDGMRFYTPNTHCAWRIETLYTKEPDTIEWLKGMKAGEVLYDIGANIGQYSVFAAHLGVKVFAFEPESQNFAILMRNIMMNNMQDRIVPFPFCIGETCKVDTLRLSSLVGGGSCHTFGSDMNFKGENKEWAGRQGSVSFPIDQLVNEIGFTPPDHIKIDVDGLESDVLKGMQATLRNIKSVLVEMDSNQERHMEWKRRLENDYGFRTEEAQILAARRTEGAFTGIGNIIFYRDSANVSTVDLQTPVGTVESDAGQAESVGLSQAA